MLNGPLGSISVGTDRAQLTYDTQPVVTSVLSPDYIGDEAHMRPLLRSLPTDTLRTLAAWCTEEADARPA